jgi:hypothetical protein
VPRRLKQFTLEKVVPVRLQMIEDRLKILDVPGFWELKPLKCLKKNPLCEG